MITFETYEPALHLQRTKGLNEEKGGKINMVNIHFFRSYQINKSGFENHQF